MAISLGHRIIDERVIQSIGRSFILVQWVASILFAKLVRRPIRDELGARLRLRFQGDSNKDDRLRRCQSQLHNIWVFILVSRLLQNLEAATKMQNRQVKIKKKHTFSHYYGLFSFEMTGAGCPPLNKQQP
jgi:hypothetical protein